MDTLAPQPGDIVVFLGDLVDKGPNALGVVRAVRNMAENAPFDVVLIEGNHEDLHRRYRRKLAERPEIAAEQAARHADPMTEKGVSTAPLDTLDQYASLPRQAINQKQTAMLQSL